nr:hypothetical protein [Macrococcus sp. IME1552]
MKLFFKIIAYTIITMIIILNMTDDIIKMQFAFYFSLLGVFIVASADLIKREQLKERN